MFQLIQNYFSLPDFLQTHNSFGILLRIQLLQLGLLFINLFFTFFTQLGSLGFKFCFQPLEKFLIVSNQSEFHILDCFVYLKPSSTTFSKRSLSARSAAPNSSQLFLQAPPATIAHSSDPSQQSQIPSFTLDAVTIDGLKPKINEYLYFKSPKLINDQPAPEKRNEIKQKKCISWSTLAMHKKTVKKRQKHGLDLLIVPFENTTIYFFIRILCVCMSSIRKVKLKIFLTSVWTVETPIWAGCSPWLIRAIFTITIIIIDHIKGYRITSILDEFITIIETHLNFFFISIWTHLNNETFSEDHKSLPFQAELLVASLPRHYGCTKSPAENCKSWDRNAFSLLTQEIDFCWRWFRPVANKSIL